MDVQTRKLLSLLSEELTESILEALREGPLTEKELVERLGTSQKTMNRRLHKLEELEAIGKRDSPARQVAGARPKVFQIIPEVHDELVHFCDQADDFALILQQKRAERMERRIRANRRARLQSIEEVA